MISYLSNNFTDHGRSLRGGSALQNAFSEISKPLEEEPSGAAAPYLPQYGVEGPIFDFAFYTDAIIA